MYRENIPLIPAAIKLRAGHSLLECLPALELPMKGMGPLGVIAKIWHVFGGESFIWRTGVRDVQGVAGSLGEELTVESRYNLFGFYGRVVWIV